jgi:hypothetical protein
MNNNALPKPDLKSSKRGYKTGKSVFAGWRAARITTTNWRVKAQADKADIAALSQAAKESLPNTRLIYLAFLTYLIYYLTVTYSTDHHDLLFDTKVHVLWNILEIPRSLLLGVGACILTLFHYKALWYHNRSLQQLRAFRQALITDRQKRKASLLLTGNLLIDVIFPLGGMRTASYVALLILGAVLVIAPLIALLFALSVSLPKHSDILSGIIRLALIADLGLLIWSWFSWRKSPIAALNNIVERDAVVVCWKRASQNIGQVLVATALLACATSIATMAVFVLAFPGEAYYRNLVSGVARFASNWVIDPSLETESPRLYAFGLGCNLNYDETLDIVPKPEIRVSQSRPSVQPGWGDMTVSDNGSLETQARQKPQESIGSSDASAINWNEIYTEPKGGGTIVEAESRPQSKTQFEQIMRMTRKRPNVVPVFDEKGNIKTYRRELSYMYIPSTNVSGGWVYALPCKLDEKSLIIQVVLATHLAHIAGTRFLRSLDLSNRILNGQTLSPEDRQLLESHTQEAPLHPRFHEVMKRLNTIDLSGQDLSYARFDNSWMPKMVIDFSNAKGATFFGSRLMGSELRAVAEPYNYLIKIFNAQRSTSSLAKQLSVLNGADLSGASLTNSIFEDTLISFIAISVAILRW